MSAIHISDPEPAIRNEHTTSCGALKRNKILLAVGLGILILGGAGAAVVITLGKPSSSASSSASSSSSSSSNNPPVASFCSTSADACATGYVEPSNADEVLSSLNTAALVQPLVAALPATVDWRTVNGVVSPIKNQGGCGGCWAFSAVESMEGSFAIKYQSSIILSPQQLIDCDLTDGGCNGGWMMTAWTQYFKHSARAYGLTDSQYPFLLSSPNGKQRNSCSADDSYGSVMVTGATNIMQASYPSWSLTQEQTVMGWIAQNGPASIAVSAAGWNNYVGGIASTSTLGCSGALDHGVQLVGFGTENGVDYWIVRNSWSSTWGENGYIRLARGANTCCVLCAVQGVTVAATGYIQPSSSTTTTPAPINNKLLAGSSLYAGQQLTSPDGNQILKVTTDGNVILYKTIFAAINTLSPIWASNTFGGVNSVLTMNTDCNLLLSNNNGVAIWQSNSIKTGDSTCSSAYLAIQNDGSMVIMKGSIIIWSTSTWDQSTTQPPTITPTTNSPTSSSAKSLSIASLGCWKDDNTRVLSTKLSAASNSVMRDCGFLAYYAGKTYFGLQYGGECWGGDATYNRLGASTSCNMPCQGDSTETCGGFYALTMYAIVTTSSFDQPTQGPIASLPAPVSPFNFDHECTSYNGQSSYCWRCTNNILNTIQCQDASVLNLSQDLMKGNSNSVYPGLCPDINLQDPQDICSRSGK